MKLDTNSHSVFRLNYHMVLVVKYRRKVLNDEISNKIMEIFANIAKKYGIEIHDWNHDIDHIHCLFSAKPCTELSRFINASKSASSRVIKKLFPEIRKKLWKECFWTRSFCLISTGGATIDIIKKYIEEQGENGVK